MPIKVSKSGITFPVHKVEPATEALPTCKTRDGVNTLLTYVEEYRRANILACSAYNSDSVKDVSYHPLIAAVHLSFSQHRPLILSADMIWITIVQGFAQHVKNNAEKLRGKFVNHTGKRALICSRNDIFEDSPESAWDAAILDLSTQLEMQLGEIHGHLMTDFSTTGEIERIACAVALLDAFQPFYEYVVYCICGIPQITLEGGPQDWLKLQEKIEALKGYEIDWWLPYLRKIGDQFHRASLGDVDVEYWQDIYKQKDAYGWSRMNGWILHLIPYMRDYASGSYTVVNPLFAETEAGIGADIADPFKSRVTSRDLPGGLSSTPFTLVSKDQSGHEKSTKMQFLGGFLAVEQDAETLALRPKLGWAVRKTPAEDFLIYEALEAAPTRPALPYEQADALMTKLVNTRGFSCLPADVIAFYKACDGLDFPAALSPSSESAPATCTIRSLKDVALTDDVDQECSHSDNQIVVVGTLYLRIADVSDGSYIAVELNRNARILHVNDAQKRWGVLEESLPPFIRHLSENGGRLYKDCLNSHIS